ncbi:MAG: carbon-nitrogen hydrolase family protein [Actinomycetota bacterium]
MGRTLTALVAQVRPVSFDAVGTLSKFEDEVAMAVSQFPGVDILIFPELYLTGEDPFVPGAPDGYADRVAEPVPGPTSDRAGKVAGRSGRWIVAGSILERDGDRIYNTALVFSPDGALVARHRKIFPWRPWEIVAPGDVATVFDIPGKGRLGLMTCYEGWFPEAARGLALAGAELIVQPSMTATSDRDQEIVLARGTAITNQCFVLGVNAVSTIGGGRSIGVDPEGRVLFEGGPGEELHVEVLDMDRPGVVREHGTLGLNRVWRHFHEAPRGLFEPYRRFLEG